MADTPSSTGTTSLTPYSLPNGASIAEARDIAAFTKLDQLNANNWMIWKQRAEGLFRFAGLHGYVTGTLKRPVPNSTATPTREEQMAMAAWDKRDAHARTLLDLSVSDSEFMHLGASTTAAAMWENLCRAKEPRGLLVVMQLRAKLFERMEEGTTLNEHIAKFRDGRRP